MNEQEKQEWVYSQLNDEESKFIYEQRFQFGQDNDYVHIQKIVNRFVPEFSKNKWHPGREKEFVDSVSKNGKKVVIYGAGYYGKKVLDICIKWNVLVAFFCDSNEEKIYTKVGGVDVVSLPILMERTKIETYNIIVSPKYTYAEIIELLLNAGILKENIYKFADYCPQTLETQYFDQKILQFGQNEVFVDGGSLDFGTSKIFLDKMKELNLSCKKIYAFEPEANSIKKCKRMIQSLGINNVELIEAGLWSENTYMQFLAQDDASSHICVHVAEGENRVRVVTMDSSVLEKVTFIKMDIEGAELEALKGAKQIIKRDKPKLAICIYHKKQDLWEIPYYIKTLVPEYKLYIRHYSNNECETVLYALCNSI